MQPNTPHKFICTINILHGVFVKQFGHVGRREFPEMSHARPHGPCRCKAISSFPRNPPAGSAAPCGVAQSKLGRHSREMTQFDFSFGMLLTYAGAACDHTGWVGHFRRHAFGPLPVWALSGFAECRQVPRSAIRSAFAAGAGPCLAASSRALAFCSAGCTG